MHQILAGVFYGEACAVGSESGLEFYRHLRYEGAPDICCTRENDVRLELTYEGSQAGGIGIVLKHGKHRVVNIVDLVHIIIE